MARGGVRSSPATTSAAPTQPSRPRVENPEASRCSSVSLFRDGSYVGEGRGSRAQRSTSFSHELGDAFQILSEQEMNGTESVRRLRLNPSPTRICLCAMKETRFDRRSSFRSGGPCSRCSRIARSTESTRAAFLPAPGQVRAYFPRPLGARPLSVTSRSGRGLTKNVSSTSMP